MPEFTVQIGDDSMFAVEADTPKNAMRKAVVSERTVRADQPRHSAPVFVFGADGEVLTQSQPRSDVSFGQGVPPVPHDFENFVRDDAVLCEDDALVLRVGHAKSVIRKVSRWELADYEEESVKGVCVLKVLVQGSKVEVCARRVAGYAESILPKTHPVMDSLSVRRTRNGEVFAGSLSKRGKAAKKILLSDASHVDRLVTGRNVMRAEELVDLVRDEVGGCPTSRQVFGAARRFDVAVAGDVRDALERQSSLSR